MMKRGKLFVISGPSGAGKGTICAKLAEEPGIALSISKTTRMPRKGEVPDRSYFFVSEEDFRRDIAANGFLEYAEIYGHLYGTPREWVERQLASGLDVILEIDVQGATKVREQTDDGVYVFILPPSIEELRKRIIGRGTEDKADIERRLGNVEHEMSYLSMYDYRIINDDLEAAVGGLKSIITAERLRVSGPADEAL